MPRNVIFTKESEAVEYAKDIGGQITGVEGGFTVDEVPQIYAHEGISVHSHKGDPGGELSTTLDPLIPPGATETAKKKKPTRTKTKIPEGFKGTF